MKRQVAKAGGKSARMRSRAWVVVSLVTLMFARPGGAQTLVDDELTQVKK